MAGDLVDLVAGLGGPLLVVVTFALVFAESAILLDLFVPGEVGLVVAGAAAAEAGTPAVAIVLAAAAGAVVGDSVGYGLGRRFGESAVRRWRWSRKVLAPRLARARRHFERRGGWAVAGARWVGALRAVVPVVAGAARRPLPWFLAWDVPSAVAWSAVVGLLGYAFGDDVAGVVDRVGTVVSLAVVAAVVAYFMIRGRSARARRRSTATC